MSDERQPAGDEDFIVFEGVKKSFGEQKVLRGIDLHVHRDETLAVLGASGGGKSVILRHILGLEKPDEGTVRVDGTDITHLGERELAPVRRNIGVLFQNGALFDSMSVFHNVAFPLREAKVRDGAEIESRVRDSLEVVGLADQLEKMPANLSGGMRKRVALARAIVSRPHCVLYDEPTAGLDPVATTTIDDLILRLQREYEVCSVVVTHHLASARRIADRIAFLHEGKVRFLGTPAELDSSEDQVVRDFTAGRA
ncbi:MAG: ABC transporter ATP-binding protein, partial [Verrucomicrobiota bacterium]